MSWITQAKKAAASSPPVVPEPKPIAIHISGQKKPSLASMQALKKMVMAAVAAGSQQKVVISPEPAPIKPEDVSVELAVKALRLKGLKLEKMELLFNDKGEALALLQVRVDAEFKQIAELHQAWAGKKYHSGGVV